MPRLRIPFRRSKPPLGLGAPGRPLPPHSRRPAGPVVPVMPAAGTAVRPPGTAEARRSLREVLVHDPAAELVAFAVVLAAVARLAEGPALWGAALLAGGALALASLEVLGASEDDDTAAPGVPVESLLLPAVTGIAGATAIHLVPLGLLLVPGLVGVGALVAAAIAVERRILGRRSGATTGDQAALLSLVVLAAFIAFTGIAASIPGALVEPLPMGEEAGQPGISLEELGLLAALDGLVAGLLGYRLAAVRGSSARAALGAAFTYAAVIAIAAAALRALALPLLLGPALLTLVFYLWSAYRGVPRAASRDARWVWEVALLAVLGIVVLAWNVLAPR